MPAEAKSVSAPDEVRKFQGNGQAEVVQLAGREVLHATFEPGWRWSENIKPIAGTDTCQVNHLGYCLQGSMTVQMDDGSSMTMKAGDFASIPPGHDAWVDGDEACVFVDFGNVADYARG